MLYYILNVTINLWIGKPNEVRELSATSHTYYSYYQNHV